MVANQPLIWIISLLVVGVGAFIAGWIVNNKMGESKIANANAFAEKIISDAKKEAENVQKTALLEAKEQWHKAEIQFQADTQRKREELQRLETQIAGRERELDKKADILSNQEKGLKEWEQELASKEKRLKLKDQQLSSIIKEQNAKLKRIAGMSAEAAKKMLMANLEQKAKKEAARMAKEIKDQAIKEANREAKEIITRAIQRCATDHTVETTVSVVPLPNDDIKGRIIGREGRNIRSFENATGVDVIVDDTPEAVILSGFDRIRREIARIALEKLIADGRIHPGRIEDVVGKTKKEMEEMIRETGEQAAFEVGIQNLHPQLIMLLGKLKYRTSYGQNVLQHSKEVAYLAGLMASELGLDVAVAKRAGLLHDIGKAVDHEEEGTHTQIGLELARKYNESPVVQNAIAAHHEDVEPTSPISILVQAADAISGARPGARRETLEGYIKRLEKLENIVDSFEGVEKCYAIQAGREVRVIVNSELIDDAQAEQLAGDIAEKIESEMEYPGQIKVTVIREVRAIDYAK
ncbi:MAG: ribonuclease Y [Candidatus Latescibacterota bacterium]|nr:MAG: ribonuclease Y [Candidatus Latescibacterota bacterium]RKY72473.1 MAG: ribonuclease Y [Candidatus Latescibacterota bacterium]